MSAMPTNSATGTVVPVTEPTQGAVNEPTKRCRVCGDKLGPKPLSAFPPHPKSHDGHFNTCSACLSRKQIAVAQETAALKARRAAEPTQPTLETPRPSEQLREVRYRLGVGEVIQPAEVRRREEAEERARSQRERISDLEAELARHEQHEQNLEEALMRKQGQVDRLASELSAASEAAQSVGAWGALAQLPTIALYKWLTEPTPAPAHGEGLLIPTEAEGALLVLRLHDDFYLLSGASDLWPTPDRAIDPEVLLYIVRLKTNTSAADDEIEGVRFA